MKVKEQAKDDAVLRFLAALGARLARGGAKANAQDVSMGLVTAARARFADAAFCSAAVSRLHASKNISANNWKISALARRIVLTKEKNRKA